MKIAILGTGVVGRTIAAKLNQLGHKVTIGTRDTNATLSNEKGDAYGNPPFKDWKKGYTDIGLETFKVAAAGAEIVFNCTSGMASLTVLNLAGKDTLNGKILIDISNPLDFSKGMPPSLNPVNTDSLGEQIQRQFPNVKVVKTLNTMSALLMVDPSRIKGDHNVFICGNEEGARKKTAEILNSFGWSNSQIIDLGDITAARGTEMLLPVWLRIMGTLGTADFNFHIQKN